MSDDWDLDALREKILLNYFLLPTFLDVTDIDPVDYPWADTEELETALIGFVNDAYHAKLESFGEAWEQILSFITLSVIDGKWKDHLYDLDLLRDSIRYRAYGQRDPLVEYKREAFEAFVDLMDDMRRTMANRLFRAQLEQPRAMRAQRVTRLSGPSDAPCPTLYARGPAAVSRAKLVWSFRNVPHHPGMRRPIPLYLFQKLGEVVGSVAVGRSQPPSESHYPPRYLLQKPAGTADSVTAARIYPTSEFHYSCDRGNHVAAGSLEPSPFQVKDLNRFASHGVLHREYSAERIVSEILLRIINAWVNQ